MTMTITIMTTTIITIMTLTITTITTTITTIITITTITIMTFPQVVTYSTVDNFEYQTWKDFSDLRLIDPSRKYPVIEVMIIMMMMMMMMMVMMIMMIMIMIMTMRITICSTHLNLFHRVSTSGDKQTTLVDFS